MLKWGFQNIALPSKLPPPPHPRYSRPYKHLPDYTLLAHRATYWRQCQQCQTPLSVSPLIAHHGLRVGMDAALEQYQLLQTREGMKSNMRTIVKMALQLGLQNKDARAHKTTRVDSERLKEGWSRLQWVRKNASHLKDALLASNDR